MPGLPMKATGTGTAEPQIPQPLPRDRRDITLAEQGEAGGTTGCSEAPQMLSHQACCILNGSFCSLLSGKRDYGPGSSVPLLQ